jgi:hypothetical protein
MMAIAPRIPPLAISRRLVNRPPLDLGGLVHSRLHDALGPVCQQRGLGSHGNVLGELCPALAMRTPVMRPVRDSIACFSGSGRSSHAMRCSTVAPHLVSKGTQVAQPQYGWSLLALQAHIVSSTWIGPG